MYTVIWNDENGNRTWIKTIDLNNAKRISEAHADSEICVSLYTYDAACSRIDALCDVLKDIKEMCGDAN